MPHWIESIRIPTGYCSTNAWTTVGNDSDRCTYQVLALVCSSLLGSLESIPVCVWRRSLRLWSRSRPSERHLIARSSYCSLVRYPMFNKYVYCSISSPWSLSVIFASLQWILNTKTSLFYEYVQLETGTVWSMFNLYRKKFCFSFLFYCKSMFRSYVVFLCLILMWFLFFLSIDKIKKDLSESPCHYRRTLPERGLIKEHVWPSVLVFQMWAWFIVAHLQYSMFIYLHQFARHVPGSSTLTGASISFYYLLHRRFYADQRSSSNHYDALGVKSDASAQEIKAAFYKLSKKHHPDVNPSDVDASKKFSALSNAYDILGDPVKRREYDNEVFSKRSAYDPYVTYNRTTNYAQRARAHRPSSWKPPNTSSSSNDFEGGFENAKSNFGNSRSTNHGTSGHYRGPTPPEGHSHQSDFEEFYRTQYDNAQSWTQTSNETSEDAPREDEPATRWNRVSLSKLLAYAVWLSLGIVGFFTSSTFHEMNFQQPTSEFRSRFNKFSRASDEQRSYQYTSEKSWGW